MANNAYIIARENEILNAIECVHSARHVLLEGETRYRRVMVWQFSNVGTVFVRVMGEALIIRNEWDIPAVELTQQA